MNKTRRTLIISSCIMALALVVTIVSVSAAWFGNTRSASKSGFVIESDTLGDSASIDINSAQGLDDQSIYPAIIERGYLLKEGAVAPTGAVLKGDTLPAHVEKNAVVATVYFPVQYVGAPDSGYALENRKSLCLTVNSANIKDDDSKFDYKDEFNIDVCLVTVTRDENGQLQELGVVTTSEYYSSLTQDSVFYRCDGYNTYMLLQPGVNYYIKAEIYFNKVDEECNFDLLDTTITFNFEFASLTDDGSVIREKYKEGA